MPSILAVSQFWTFGRRKKEQIRSIWQKIYVGLTNTCPCAKLESGIKYKVSERVRALGCGKGNQVKCLSDPVTVSRKVCPGGHCVRYVRRRAGEGTGRRTEK